MRLWHKYHLGKIFFASSTLAALAFGLVAVRSVRSDDRKPNDPWAPAQTIQAADFVRELAEKSGTPPTIVYVGFRTLFAGGHIPGATFHGSASKEEGLAEIKKWADALPRETNLMIYCGCCPFEKCPNIRPAFTALHEMGFTHLRVLILPTSFAADWAEKGFPISKGL
jgi:thiosulfate/3-mercaptopyruvate sulfurtransferase